jgi:hypothetical protein
MALHAVQNKRTSATRRSVKTCEDVGVVADRYRTLSLQRIGFCRIGCGHRYELIERNAAFADPSKTESEAASQFRECHWESSESWFARWA